MQEIDKLFESNWEEHYDNEKVRSIYLEMKELADTYCVHELRGKKDATGIFSKLQEMKKELEDAIAEVRGQKSDQTQPESKLLGMGALKALARESEHSARVARFEIAQAEVTAQKASKLAKVGLCASVFFAVLLGGAQGYLFLENQASTEAAIKTQVNTVKAALKTEISGEILTQVSSAENPQVQSLSTKDLELEGKISMLETEIGKIAELEIRAGQFQVELDKSANLRAKVSELEHQFKSKKTAAAPAVKVSRPSKSIASTKQAKKPAIKKPRK